MQTIIGKTGKESLKRQCEEFNMDNVPLDVALGSRELLKDISIEQVRKVSAGAATFYVWVSTTHLYPTGRTADVVVSRAKEEDPLQAVCIVFVDVKQH